MDLKGYLDNFHLVLKKGVLKLMTNFVVLFNSTLYQKANNE